MRHRGAQSFRNLVALFALLVGAGLLVTLARGSAGPDGVTLRLAKGPGAEDVTLTWTGGQSPFQVFRDFAPTDVVQSLNSVAETESRAWVDTPPPGDLLFYQVTSTCVPNPPELCDGIDNDCDPATADGQDDPSLGVPCDGADSDLCQEGTLQCSGGDLECTDSSGDTLDLCDGVDNDCDPSTADGHDEPTVDQPCDGPDHDLCLEGTWVCNAGVMECSDSTWNTWDICDGIDNDCNPATDDGDEDVLYNKECDGPDHDQCIEGVYHCVDAVMVCDDDTSSTPDICNGVDDDCDDTTYDGLGDPLEGVECDGADADLCEDGLTACVDGVIVCQDYPPDPIELCDGLDNDCNPATPDGIDDPNDGAPCDGADADLCMEGISYCSAGSLHCTDPDTDTGNLELCDSTDNDCDPSTPDGADDPAIGEDCDGADADLCVEGTVYCDNGLKCSDTTSSTAEECNGFDDDCDGETDEDFPRDTNPTCGTGWTASVAGDTGSEHATFSSYDERWIRLTVREDSGDFIYLSATIELYSPPGADFDLYVYCDGCSGTLAGYSDIGGSEGHTDVVDVRADDEGGIEDGFDVWIEVRHYQTTHCLFWSMDILGNTITDFPTCD